MNNKKQTMFKLRSQGMTYQEIADVVGCSKSYVGSILSKSDKSKFRTITPKDCVYVGIRNWMNENKISKAELCRMIYGYVHPVSNNRLAAIYKGHGCTKETIDMILAATGLTYEEAFKTEDDSSAED